MNEESLNQATLDKTSLSIEVFSIFPEVIASYCSVSILGRAQRSGMVDIIAHDLRDGAIDARRSVDDTPFGGGAGMVLAPEPVFAAVEQVTPKRPLYLLSATGPRFSQAMARELAELPGFSLLCGRYEGTDDRIAAHLVDGEICIGDFVLAGGELAALVVIESVVRLVPGVLGNEASLDEESFAEGILEYPQFTRPAEFRGWHAPDVLLSGDHAKIARWRHVQALVRTLERRPDLIVARGGLSEAEVQLLSDHGYRYDADSLSFDQQRG